MLKKSAYLVAAIAILGVATIYIQPAIGELITASPDTAASPLPPPGDPAPAPGETRIPPSTSPEEDAFVEASPAEQQELLGRLRKTVDCARAKGANVPDPVAVDVGALIPWRGGEPNRATSETLEACFEAPQ